MALGVEVEGEHLDLLPVLVEALRSYPRGVSTIREAEQVVVGILADDMGLGRTLQAHHPEWSENDLDGLFRAMGPAS